MNNNTKTMLLILFAYTILGITGCKQSTEPKLEVEMILELEDVSCTEAWIKLTTNNLQLPATINLLKNNTVAQSFSLSSKDSLLYIDSLLPNQTYKLQVSHIVAGSIQNPVSSNELTVTTMDTTSHEFTWQSWEFGECSSSSLYDVAIIDENNIWAVGEIYIRDSLGNCDPNAYNAVHWDGTKWQLKRIGNIGGWVCHSVFAFSATDIWFEGNIHFDGTRYSAQMNGWPLMPNGDGWQVNKMWGTSSSNLYAVGNNGNIAHWDGVKWRKIESGTNLDIYDIWGENLENSGKEILSIASDKYLFNDKKVYKIVENNIFELSNEGLPWSLSSIWFKSKHKCYISGDGLFVKNSANNFWQDITQGITKYYTHSIRGTGLNDITVSGSFGELLHFNGLSWYSYKGKELPSFTGNYFAVGIKGRIVCAVGQATLNSNVAVISLGIR